MKRTVIGILTGLSLIAAPLSAADVRKDATLAKGPSIREAMSPYGSALQCLATQLTNKQKETSFSAGFFPDRTGKVNYVSDAGTGSFSSQGLEDMVLTSLSQTGVVVVDSSPAFRQSMDWTIGKMIMGGQGSKVQLMNPDVVINGAITTFDFLPGSGLSANVAGIKLSHQQSRILVSMDARAVLMPGTGLPGPAGKIVATDKPSKQIVGYEDSAGGSGFFGPRNSATYVSLDFGHKPNEAVQYAERIMVDRVVFKLVSQVFNVTTCQPQLEYADQMVNLQ